MEPVHFSAPVKSCFQLNTDEYFVVIGSGIAAVSAATAIRQRNQTASITLLNEEPCLPYSRPMLTKTSFRGFSVEHYKLYDENFYKTQNISLRCGSPVTHIDSIQKQASLATGETLPFDKCICATGAECFVPPIKGNGKNGVFTIRRGTDIESIRRRLLTAQKAVVIGGGVIGIEIAWELKKAGLDIVVLELAQTLMERILDAETAQFLERQLVQAGIRVYTSANIAAITGEKRADGVQLADGTRHVGDFVILSTGIQPNTALAQQAGAETGRGISVNEHMQTSLPNLYACGDCAEYRGQNAGTWGEAMQQGTVAGANAAGEAIAFAGFPIPLSMSAANTNLFSIGDMGKAPGAAYEVRRVYNRPSAFAALVNPRPPASESMESYYFCGGRLCGAALVGDLSRRMAVEDAVDKGQTMEEFTAREGGNEAEPVATMGPVRMAFSFL